MRSVAILAMLLGALFLAACGKGKQEAQERQKRDRQAQEEQMRKQQEEANAMAAQAEQRFAQSMNCDTVIRNRQVLHDAMERGGTVFSIGGDRPAPKNPEDMRAAFNDAQAYIEQNCADTVANYRRPGGHCTYAERRNDLVCR